MSNPYLRLLLLTLVRIPIALVLLLWLLATDNSPANLTVTLILLLMIELSDFFDGFIARKYKLTSELGATLDPYADSTARLITYTALAFDHLALMAVPIVMAIRDVTVAYTRVIVTRSGKSASAHFSGKAKAVVQAIGAFLLVLSPVFWPTHQPTILEAFLFTDIFKPMPVQIISWIVILVTLASMIEYIVRAIPAMRSSLPNRPQANYYKG